MKTIFQIEINQASQKIFFPHERIKDKYKIIEILLEACRYILYSKLELKVKAKYKIIVNKDKMNRLFFVGDSKIYSIAFPFNISHTKDETIINYKNLIDIDSFAITSLLGILKSPIINSDSCLDFIDPIVEIEEQYKLNYWQLLRDLILLEDGYIRYDKDEDGYKIALEKKQRHRHPLNHVDIFYTNQATFKLGLDQECPEEDFIDTLDSNTNCKYLKAAI